MCRQIFACVILVILLTKAQDALLAQPVEFSTGEAQKVAAQFTGDATNWPVVLELARHDINRNILVLSEENMQRLKNFSSASSRYQQYKKTIDQSIKQGAEIFAKKPLDQAKQLIKEYKSAVQQGKHKQATELVEKLGQLVPEIESTLSMNRKVAVQAELSDKEGDVDKRKGLLGSWEIANIGDYFAKSDGIKTFENSLALLSFIDGSLIEIEQSTVAIIRESRIDKLTKSVNTDIVLEDGGVLAKLSAAAKNKGNYNLEAGNSQTQIQSTNLYAQSDNSRQVKLSNYDGLALVQANDVTVTIQKNEGTVIEQGGEPSQPIQLLEAPSYVYSNSDTVIYEESFRIAFNEVDSARMYRLEVSTSNQFTENLTIYEAQGSSVLLGNLAMGTNYIHIQSIDKYGLRGPFSKTYRIIRNEDNQPPPLFFSDIEDQVIYTKQDQVVIKGVTEPETNLSVNNTAVKVQGDGSFSTIVTLRYTDNEASITVTATDNSQNSTNEKITVVKVDTSRLSSIQFNANQQGETLTLKRDILQFSGTAYPKFKVLVKNGSIEQNIQTDNNGRWGGSIQAQPGPITFQFIDASNNNVLFSKTFNLERPN